MEGMPLYEYARSGKPLPKPIEARSCTIHELELLSFKKGGDHTWEGAKEEMSAEEKENMIRLERLVADSVAESSTDAAAAAESPSSTAPANEAAADLPRQETADEAESAPPAFEIRMTVSSGTYVRSLIHDIAIALGSAAHVVELVRTRQGQYALDPEAAHTVEGEDSKEALQATVPWSILSEGIKEMQAKRPKQGKGSKFGNNTSEQPAEADGNGDAKIPVWEEAIVKAIR